MRSPVKFKLFEQLNGGLSTLPTPLLVEGAKGPMKSPDLKNVDLFRRGGVSKRLGKAQVGDTFSVTAWVSQTTSDSNGTSPFPERTNVVAGSFVATSSVSISSITIKIAELSASGGFSCLLYLMSNSGGEPLAVLTNGQSASQIIQGTTVQEVTFTFTTPCAVTSGTTYWLAINANTQCVYGATTGASVKTSDSNLGPWTSASKTLYYKIYASTASQAITGIYDYRTGAAGSRQQLVTLNGNIYKRNKSGSSFLSTWTSLSSAFTVGQDYLTSFSALKDLACIANFGQSAVRAWDASAAYTPTLGYQPAATIGQAATGGALSNTSSTGYSVMLVTQLDSGGYRAKVFGPQTLTGGGAAQRIAMTSISIDEASATDFGFGIPTTATKVFMTADGGSVYYKVPTANISTAANPIANNATSFNITAVTGLTTANTLIEEYSLPQAYFTSQVACPVAKYLTTWQDFLVAAGDASNPSRVWFSEQLAPRVWSTYGQVYGNYLDVDDGDGDVVTGVFQWNGALYVAKQHSLHVVEFTGNAFAPFQRRRLPGDIGALSGFTFKDLGGYFVFLSERGIAACFGSIVALAPGMGDILDFFDPNDSNRFNLAITAFGTAGHNRVKSQVWFGVANTGSTNRDLVLVFDYANRAFWLDDGISGNYFTEVGDANGFFSVWSGDYSGKVFQHDSGTSDAGVPIDWYFSTPHLGLADPYAWKSGAQLFVAGDTQSSGTLSVDVFVDRSTTLVKTLSFDMTAARFKVGYEIPIGVRFKTVQFKFRNSTLDVPVHIDSFGVYFSDAGAQV